MNKKEAYKLLLDGKKIARSMWGAGKYLYMSDDGDIKNQYSLSENLNDYRKDGWVEYKEPTRKEVPKQVSYIKDLYKLLNSGTLICNGLDCELCPLNLGEAKGCIQDDLKGTLSNLNKTWNLGEKDGE